MARILVLGVKIPFTSGGQEALVGSLVKELRNRGHQADTIELPLSLLPKEKLLNQAALWRTIDLEVFGGEKTDLVIATKFPTYYAKHPKKSLWLVHQHRAMYDLYGSRYSDISDEPRDEELRKLIRDGDSKVIGECAYVGAISRNVAERLRLHNGIKAEVLYPPLPLGDRYRSGNYENYVLSVGRLCSIKRVDLMIKSLPVIHNFVKLKVVGAEDEPGVMRYFQNEIDKHHLWKRVEFLGKVSDEALLDLYSKALAVYYAPHNEDYGYVTLEAMASSRPVITASDSGGALEFIKHMESGLVAEPNVDSISRAVNLLVEDRSLPSKLGAAGRLGIEDSGLLGGSWDKVVNGLLSPLGQGNA